MPNITNDDNGAVLTAGTILTVSAGGTGSDLSATGGSHQVVKQSGAGAALTVAALGAGDVPDVALTSNVPLKNAANTFNGGDQTISNGGIILSAGLTEYGRSVPMGTWAGFTPAFAAQGGGSISGGTVTTARRMYVGQKTVVIQVQLTNFSVSGTVTAISMTLPDSLTSNSQATATCPISNDGTYGVGFVQSGANPPSNASLFVYRDFVTSAWSASTTNSIFAFTIIVEFK